MISKRLSILYTVCLILTLTLLFASPAAYAAEASPEDMAASLKELGLFLGTNYGFELDKPCDRLMGAVILTRLLGREEEAKNSSFSHPFADVTGSYAEPYIGYLYQQGLTNGVSAALYGRNNMTGQQFATLTLRALGYADEIDFQWNTALSALADLGIISEVEALALAEGQFLRAKAVLLSYRALTALPKNADKPLINKMLWEDVFTTRQLARSKDAGLLLAADMPDFMGFAVTAYTEREFGDIFWLSLRNRQSNLSIYAPWFTPIQVKTLVDGLLSPYFERDFFLDSSDSDNFSYDDNGNYNIFTYISEYMSMQFYYENPDRYEKNFQFYDAEYRQPLSGYISMYLWRDKLESIVSTLIEPQMSEYEQVKALHDYVALNIEYDQNADEYSNSHFAEGALFYGLAVCDGYSSALKMLLNAAGIESLVIYGDSLDVPHAWNQVKIDGEWFNMDVTWAASIGKGEVYYGYFCAPDSIFLLDHTPEKPNIAHSCDSKEYYQKI